jgi:hypothetical protein
MITEILRRSDESITVPPLVAQRDILGFPAVAIIKKWVSRITDIDDTAGEDMLLLRVPARSMIL